MDATRPTKGVVAPPEDLAGHFGYLSWAASLDNPTSSALTQRLLGPHRTHPGLVEDLDEGHYFQISRENNAGNSGPPSRRSSEGWATESKPHN
jgi:hypothetical protein